MVQTNLLLSAAALASIASASDLQPRQIYVHPVDANVGYLTRIESSLNTVTGPGAADNAAAVTPTIRSVVASGVASHLPASGNSAGGVNPVVIINSQLSRVSTIVPVPAIPTYVPAAPVGGGNAGTRHIVYVTLTTYYDAGYETVEAAGVGIVSSGVAAATSAFGGLFSHAASVARVPTAAGNQGAVASVSALSALSAAVPSVASAAVVAFPNIASVASVASVASDLPAAVSAASAVVPATASSAMAAVPVAAGLGAIGADGVRGVAPHVAPYGAVADHLNGAAGAAVTASAASAAVEPASASPAADAAAVVSSAPVAVASADAPAAAAVASAAPVAEAPAAVVSVASMGMAPAVASAAPVADAPAADAVNNVQSVASMVAAAAPTANTGGIHVHPVQIGNGILAGYESAVNTVTGPIAAAATGALMY